MIRFLKFCSSKQIMTKFVVLKYVITPQKLSQKPLLPYAPISTTNGQHLFENE